VKVAAMTAPTHNPSDESHTGELLAGKPPEQFLGGGAGNGPSSCWAPRQSLTRQRFFAWMQWRRRLLVRWEYYPINFLGFVQLAAICVLLRQF
jgi:hypothetical protein